MNSADQRRHSSPQHPHSLSVGRRGRRLRRWLFSQTLAAGVMALIWLIVRTGTKPSRFVYPCQQAAFSAATLAFGAPLVTTVLAIKRRALEGLSRSRTVAIAASGLIVTLAIWGWGNSTPSRAYLGPTPDQPDQYRAQVFHRAGVPQDPFSDRFLGLDDLLATMGSQGLKFHRSAIASLTAGPDGIISSDDTVIIKINYQWSERGGTNTDLLRGLIEQIIRHPDEFTGEIVVCENAQFASTEAFDRSRNNAQDISQSPHDVVVDYQLRGVRISHYDWTLVRYNNVQEFITGDLDDGYIVYTYEPALFGRRSYPKFTTSFGTQISLRFGIWNQSASTYDR
ncbi:MAG: hypothetical protein JSV80_10310, partial [Acidobacteriota bacterium]